VIDDFELREYVLREEPKQQIYELDTLRTRPSMSVVKYSDSPRKKLAENETSPFH